MAKYSLDTSAILDAWIRYYPIDLFPSFWERFEQLCRSKEALIIELVNYELAKKDDGCSKWLKNKGLTSFFIEINDDLQLATKKILENPRYQLLIENRKGVFGADPFIIAHAQIANCTLVTGEKPTGSIKRPKIPDVCNELNIPWINIQQLMRTEKWAF